MQKITIEQVKSRSVKKTLPCNDREKVPDQSEINALLTLYGQGCTTEVETIAKSFSQRFPKYGFGWKILGVVLQHHGQYQEALTALQKAAELLPNDDEVHGNLGFALNAQGLFIEAEASYRRAIIIAPDSFFAHCNLGYALLNQGKPAEASFRKALEINPDLAEAHSNLLFCLSHNETITAETLFAEHGRFGQRFEAPLRAFWPQHSNLRDPERCLRVGFVSGDLRNHAVANFIEPVLAHLAGYPQLALYAYYNHSLEDSVTLRLREYLRHWYPIAGLSDDALADKIRADGIDILIDLSGHTAKNRLLTFARKPAPVQVSWMGYPGTTGLSAMDYFLADRFLLPPGQFDDQFTEKIVYLPAYAPFLPEENAPPVNVLPALCKGYITFGSFNHLSKLGPSVIGLWAKLLRALPDSRMVLGGMPADGQYDILIDRFAKEGIERERLSFYPRCGMTEYLALHQQVDLCLDTFPYSGGITTLNALWMGVPTLTLAGHTVAGRSGAAIFGHVGLNAFVARDIAEFVRKGLSWASDPASLANVRVSLRGRFEKSLMGQPTLVAAGYERALRMMWQRWCDGLPAQSFEVKPQDINNIVDKDGSMKDKENRPEKTTMKNVSRKENQHVPDAEESGMLTTLFKQNRFAEAEALARSIASRFPLYGYAWKVLGIALYQLGRMEEALLTMQKTAALLPDDAEAHYNLAFNFHEQHRLIEAEASLRTALELKPDYAAAHNDLGIILKQQNRLDEAEACYRRVLEICPNLAEAHSNLGNLLFNQGRLAEAEASFLRALEINPVLAEAHSNLGNVFMSQGRLNEAEISFCRVLEINPGLADAHSNLGNIFWSQGRHAEAEASLLSALKINPNHADAQNNLGNVFWDQGRHTEAEACFRRALEINPNLAEIHSNQGNILLAQGRMSDAETCFRKALEINPDLAEAHSNLLFCLSHNETITAETLFAEHGRFGQRFEAPLRAFWPQHSNSRDPKRCLRVGFVSGDLRNHAVANFIEPVLAHLAGYPQLALYAYYNHSLEDSVTLRLREYLRHWHPIAGLSDDALADKIRADGIDILIDLSGHTAKNRLLTFARKPAPVQVSWMGYPGTTGLRAVDYYLADRFLLPPGQFDDQFTEKIVRLPVSAPYQPDMNALPVNALPALGNGYITFGSFNQLSKLSPSVIGLWSQLLRALPDSRIMLGGMPADGQYDILIDWFAKEGVERERLSFYPRCGMTDYLALHQLADICLDTFPYNGGTTTLNALWMGVPTLTLAGHTVVGRSGAAILGHVGLNAFVAQDTTDFVRKGLSWANHPSALADVRARLRERFERSAQSQPAMAAAGVECALRMMWQRWCGGLPAESFEVCRQAFDKTMQEIGK